MGVAQNSMLALLGTAGVSASKVSGSLNGSGGSKGLNEQSSLISQAIDADRAEIMHQRALYQMEKTKQIKLQNKNLRLRNRKLREGGKK